MPRVFSQPIPLSGGPVLAGRDVCFCRGYVDFPIGRDYGAVIRQAGYLPRIVVYSTSPTDRLARSWRTNTARTIENLLTSPDSLREDSFLVGHSAGGLVVAALATITKGGNLQGVRHEVPELATKGIQVRDLERVGELLRRKRAKFVSITAPFRGLQPKGVLKDLTEPGIDIPLLHPLAHMRAEVVLGFFSAAHINPEDVMDGNIVARTEGLYLGGRLITTLVRSGMMLGGRLLFEGQDILTGSDCIIDENTSRLGIANEVVLENSDHWMVVRSEKGARALVQVMRAVPS